MMDLRKVLHNVLMENPTCNQLKDKLQELYGYHPDSYYFTLNGKIVESNTILKIQNAQSLQPVPRVVGGKGGFGSMLRAIGAQIEKTTNREACRDLSGRRLRDINEEQRLKNWITQQAEREKDAKEKRKKKLEKLCEQPKHEFNDTEYDKERSTLPELVEDAVLQGLQATSSGISVKRKNKTDGETKKKKPKLWVDEELDDELSSDDDHETEEDLQTRSDQSKQIDTESNSSEQEKVVV